MIKDGIYFNLDEATYRADPALSQSGIKMLLTDPEEFWYWSHMNPDRPPEEQKDSLDRGKLWHSRILERQTFDQKYQRAPWLDREFYAGRVALSTVDDMKAWLTGAGVEFKKTGKKADFESAIRAVPSWEKTAILMDGFTETFLKEAKTTVIYSAEVWEDMLAAEAAIQAHPYFSKVFLGGFPEVSIFWTDETGLRLKARIDLLKPGQIIDYKTLYVQRGKSVRKAGLDAIKWESYDLQAAMYTLAVGHAVRMIKDGTGAIEGDIAGGFIDEFVKTPEKPFIFIFQNEARPNTVRGLCVKRRSNDSFNAFGNGLFLMQKGIDLYQEYHGKFGDKRWFDPAGITEVMDNDIYYA